MFFGVHHRVGVAVEDLFRGAVRDHPPALYPDGAVAQRFHRVAVRHDEEGEPFFAQLGEAVVTFLLERHVADGEDLVDEHDLRVHRDGDGKATPLTDAGGTPVTGADDGLGAFGGRARGDLDHESINDGAGDNVRRLRGPSAEASAAQDEGDDASVDEIMRHAAYEPSEVDDPDPKDR